MISLSHLTKRFKTNDLQGIPKQNAKYLMIFIPPWFFSLISFTLLITLSYSFRPPARVSRMAKLLYTGRPRFPGSLPSLFLTESWQPSNTLWTMPWYQKANAMAIADTHYRLYPTSCSEPHQGIRRSKS